MRKFISTFWRLRESEKQQAKQPQCKTRRSGTENASRNRAPRREPYHSSGASRTGARSRRALVERQKKKKRRRMISRIGIAVLVLLAIVFAPTIFFQVSKINVTGDTRYTSKQLIKSTGVKPGR